MSSNIFAIDILPVLLHTFFVSVFNNCILGKIRFHHFSNKSCLAEMIHESIIFIVHLLLEKRIPCWTSVLHSIQEASQAPSPEAFDSSEAPAVDQPLGRRRFWAESRSRASFVQECRWKPVFTVWFVLWLGWHRCECFLAKNVCILVGFDVGPVLIRRLYRYKCHLTVTFENPAKLSISPRNLYGFVPYGIYTPCECITRPGPAQNQSGG